MTDKPRAPHQQADQETAIGKHDATYDIKKDPYESLEEGRNIDTNDRKKKADELTDLYKDVDKSYPI